MAYPAENIIPIEVVELEDNSYHIIIPAEINGISGDMIIDTGASVTVFDENLCPLEAEREHLNELQSGSVTGQINNVQVIKANIKIGNSLFKGIQVAVINLDYVNQMYHNHLNRKIIGLLGCDFCVNNNVVIDYRNRTFTYTSKNC